MPGSEPTPASQALSLSFHAYMGMNTNYVPFPLSHFMGKVGFPASVNRKLGRVWSSGEGEDWYFTPSL